MSTSPNLQDITSRIETLLEDIRAIDGSPSPSRREFEGSLPPSRRAIEGSLPPSRRAIEGSTLPSRREIEGSPPPSRRATEASSLPSRKEFEGSPLPSRIEFESSPLPSRIKFDGSPLPSPIEFDGSPLPSRKEFDNSPPPSRKEFEGSLLPARQEFEGSLLPSRREFEGSLPPSRREFEGSLMPSLIEFEGSPPPARRAFDSSLLPSRRAIEGSLPPSRREFEGSLPPSRREFEGSVMPSLIEFEGSPPPARREFEGSLLPSRREFEGSPPPSRREFEGSPPPSRREFEGSPPSSRREFEGSPPPLRREFEGSPPPLRREFEGSPLPSRREFDGSPPPSRREFEASPPPSRRVIDFSLPPSRRTTVRSPSRRSTEGSPSLLRPSRNRLLFEGSPGTQTPGRRAILTPERSSPFHTACILPAQNIDDITNQMKKELQTENEKRRKLERSLSHVQEELDKTKALANDVNQSKRLALAMLKELHNQHSKLQRKYQQSIRNSQHNESLQRSLNSTLGTQERKLSSLSQQLQSEASRRLELENRLNRQENARHPFDETMNETVRPRFTLEDQIRPTRMEDHGVSSDEMYQDCQEDPQQEISDQDFRYLRQSVMASEKLNKRTSDKGDNAFDLDKSADEIIILRNRCAELEKQLIQASTVSQELSAAKKRCNELETQLREYTAVSTELNEYRDRLQKNVHQLRDVQTAFTQLQEAFRSAQTESNMRLEEKEKLIATLKENETLMNTENETLREIVKDLNELAQSYLERIQDLWNKKAKQEKELEQKIKELKEKEKSVFESDYELKAMCERCTEQEKQIKELQKAVDALEDKYGNLTVESATYACENVVRRERLEDDIEKNREVLKGIENELETKNKIVNRQAYTIVQLKCKVLKQDRDIQRLQTELDRLYEDNMDNEEDLNTHKNCNSKMEHLMNERNNAVRYAMYVSQKLQFLKKILYMYLKKEAKMLYFLKHQIVKKHQMLIQRKLQQINYSDPKMHHDLRRLISSLSNKRRYSQ